MLTGKQRSYLKGIAHGLEPRVHIGKAGLTENIVRQIDDQLKANEIIKVKLQEGCDASPEELMGDTAGQLSAEFVQAIGRKFTLYRQAVDPQKRKIKLP